MPLNLCRRSPINRFGARIDVELSGQKYHFRSAVEARRAAMLDILKRAGAIIDWAYEPKTFYFYPPHIPKGLKGKKNGVREYTPDFWIKDTDGKEHFEECKGYLAPRDLTKLRLMSIYYPDVPIWLIVQRMQKQYAPATAYCQRIYVLKDDMKKIGLL